MKPGWEMSSKTPFFQIPTTLRRVFGASYRKIWYYQLNLDRKLSKTRPLSEDNLAEFVELEQSKADSRKFKPEG